MILTDLHRHLDGSLRLETLHQLAQAVDVTVPDDLYFRAGMGLQDALTRFQVTLSVLQTPGAVRRVASEMCEDAAREGLRHLEIRFAPQLHRGATIPEIVNAAAEGIAGRAGLILCVLYGEDPSVAEALVDAAASQPAVVGLDLAGGPAPVHRWSMRDYANAFGRARDLGLGRTVHASEGRPPDEIRVAIETLHAQRIGHGTTLLDDPEVVALVRDREVTIEACPTSNVHTGVLDDVGSHPIGDWLRAGVRACVCADNTLFSRTTAVEELERLRSSGGLDPDQLRQVSDAGLRAVFVRGAR